MFDLESEAMRGLGSIPTGGNILSLDFFHVVKTSDANIGIIDNFVYLWKTQFFVINRCDSYNRYIFDINISIMSKNGMVTCKIISGFPKLGSCVSYTLLVEWHQFHKIEKIPDWYDPFI